MTLNCGSRFESHPLNEKGQDLKSPGPPTTGTSFTADATAVGITQAPRIRVRSRAGLRHAASVRVDQAPLIRARHDGVLRYAAPIRVDHAALFVPHPGEELPGSGEQI